MVTVPDDKAQALPILNGIRADKTKCTMFVFGDGVLADDAKLRENTPLRRVAFVPDPSVMDGVGGYEKVNAKRAAGAVVVTMTLDFKVSSTLDAGTANIGTIEEAFQNAQLGQVEP